MTPLPTLTTINKTLKEVKTPGARGMAKEIALNPALNEGVRWMMGRMSEMRSPLTALLAGIAADPKARRLWEDSLDEQWAEEGANFDPASTKSYPEVFIGSGLSAAVFCATRAAMGRPVPIVLEAGDRAGGAFAVSRNASFYLNSRNRPGGLGIPGTKGALNYVPNGPIQPSELGFEEFQVNTDMAFAIRAVFAHTGARVIPSTKVSRLRIERDDDDSSDWTVLVGTNRGSFKADMAYVGTGLSQPRRTWFAGERLLNFEQFMRRLDSPFPFRDLGRVAVIGAGDSGKVVIEALTGQGPARHMSVNALDYPEDIVWYGQTSSTRVDFEQCNRSRYRRIGSLLEEKTFRNQRVRPYRGYVTDVAEGYDCVLVDGQPFDLAINCTGVSAPQIVCGIDLDYAEYWESGSGSERYARFLNDDYGEPRIFFVGPSAKLPRSEGERIATPFTDNGSNQRELRELEVAAWRYTGRTAMLAKGL